MSRIDHRPMTATLNGTDGAQLQRHLLQTLERQWLDSWGAASAAQPESGGASPERDAAPAPPFTAHEAADRAHAEAGSAAAAPSSPASAPAHDTQAGAQHSAPYEPVRPPATADDHRAAGTAPLPDPAGESAVTSAAAPAAQPRGSRDAGREPAAAVEMPWAVPAATAAAPYAMTAMTAGLAFTALPAPPASRAEAEPAARPRLPQASQGKDGPQKLTLRELAPDVVQATLRDTQLDLAASQLAAQGLARALMEAGYAQVKVVVNGQQGRRAHPDDEGTPPLAPRLPASTDLSSPTASKDPAHGH